MHVSLTGHLNYSKKLKVFEMEKGAQPIVVVVYVSKQNSPIKSSHWGGKKGQNMKHHESHYRV